MKKIIKEAIKSSLISIGMSFTIFCIVGIIFDIIYKGSITFDNYSFTKMIIGCIIIGLGFGIPSIVYENDNLPMPIKVLIHMGIGCIIYTITSYSVGWVSGTQSLTKIIFILAIQLTIAFIIWFLYMSYYRKEVKEINDFIQKIK